VRLSGNVINLPLRQPAVLARAAASLDLLSGGPFALGLGAGAFWDAIEAMGGPRRTPGESVEALEEAIDIIRAIWNPVERRGVRVDGGHYRVAGARRGPEPAHEIAIWLGVLKPRMLRLLGRKAEGWLPSLSYLEPGDLQRSNQIIDEAAAGAGRDPREIRRLLNVGLGQDGVLEGPPEQWVLNLLPFVLEDGVSAFIIAADDPRLIEVWRTEVAPALREAVANERRGAGTAAGEAVRSPKRRPSGVRASTRRATRRRRQLRDHHRLRARRLPGARRRARADGGTAPLASRRGAVHPRCSCQMACERRAPARWPSRGSLRARPPVGSHRRRAAGLQSHG
jgi:Luciferase-like monooxygenase